MRIKATNAPAFIRHLNALAQMTNDKSSYHFDTFARLKRLEARANRITTDSCNGHGDEAKHDAALERIKKQVQSLLPNAKTIFINGDPRGYSLKIKESEVKQYNGMHTDWGGYGILAPEF